MNAKKSATILSHNMALLFLNNMTQHGMPAYLGKDTVMESYQGYELRGMVPLKAYLRLKGMFESGILLSWQKYIDFLLKLAGNSFSGLSASQVINKRKQSLIIFFIPIIGYIVALLVFIVFECKIGLFSYCMK